MPNDSVNSQAQQMQSQKAAPEEMCLKATVLTLRAVVNIPDPGVDDWKRSRSATIESHVERKVSAGDEAQFIGEVRRRCSLPTLGDKDSQLVVHPLCRLQPVQSTKDRSDVVVPRLGKHQLIRRLHHKLKPLDVVLRYASGCCAGFRDPAASRQEMPRVTGELIWRLERTDIQFTTDAVWRSMQR